jgi:very-short-patch-repair endonuclease
VRIEGVGVESALRELGGVAGRAELLAVVSRGDLARALADGTVHRVAWGRYALPTPIEALAAARASRGTAILISAAAHWNWRRKWEPRRPQVAVPRGRHVSVPLRTAFEVRWRAVPPSDVVDGWVTCRERTLVDCAVLLPFDEALAITDSALRAGDVRGAELLERAEALDPQLRPRVRRVLRLADPAAANPFESVLRAIALDVPGLRPCAQVRIEDQDGFVGRVDLADRRLRIVIEGESFEFHGEREMLDRDCARYSRLTADGWLVIRFSWTQVMTRPHWVRSVIARAVAHREQQLAAGWVPAGYTPRG